MSNNTSPYISREDSIAIKATALLLVIWGHNHYLTPLNTPFLWWLYQFHVVVFFILPIFYDSQKKQFKTYLKNLSTRCLVPYTFFYVTCLLVSLITHKIHYSGFIELMKGYFHIGGVTADNAVGFQFVWFLMAFYVFSIIRYIGSENKYVNIVFLLVGSIISLIGADNRAILNLNFPLYLSQTLYFYTLGCFAFWLNKHIKYCSCICLVIFGISSYLFFIGGVHYTDVFVTLTGFFFVWQSSKLFKRFGWFQAIGRLSLEIYLIHIYVYCILDIIMPHNWYCQLVVYVLTVVVSYFLAKLIHKCDVVRRLLFPNRIEDLKILKYK